jgi:L-threonylcarbamoyladenylate synthase
MDPVKKIKEGGVGIIPTDTIYGIVASAFNKEAVERVYDLKKRNKEKPCIILIHSPAELKKFNLPIQSFSFWPGPVSVIFQGNFPEHLSRKQKSLAFRVPKPLFLRRLLKKTGPLIAPSANLEGHPPVETITEAKKYFDVDFYISKGRLKRKPSVVVKIIR